MTKRKQEDGRPPLYRDAEIVVQFVEALETFMGYRAACRLTGVSYTTFKRWTARAKLLEDKISRGAMAYPSIESDDYHLLDFCAQVKKAREVGKFEALKKIQQSDQWQAWAWLLERCFPGEFAKKQIEKITLKTSTSQVSLVDPRSEGTPFGEILAAQQAGGDQAEPEQEPWEEEAELTGDDEW